MKVQKPTSPGSEGGGRSASSLAAAGSSRSKIPMLASDRPRNGLRVFRLVLLVQASRRLEHEERDTNHPHEGPEERNPVGEQSIPGEWSRAEVRHDQLDEEF